MTTLGHKEERLFAALAAAAERRMRDFNLLDLANIAWAFATVGHKEERLFKPLAAAAERRMRDFIVPGIREKKTRKQIDFRQQLVRKKENRAHES